MTDYAAIVLFDFQSLYPTLMISCNLHADECSCCQPSERWSGGGFFKTHGSYCTKQLCPVDATLKQWFTQRLVAKANKDKQRDYGLKILLNTAYGATGSSKFISIHSLNGARDTTGLGRQCVQYAIKEFEFHGFSALYTDTDSVYVGVPAGTSDAVNHAKHLAMQISEDLRERFPFPFDGFELKFEAEIDYLQFFKNKEKTQLMQKNYLYLTREGKVVVKNLHVMQKSCSALTLTFWDSCVVHKIKTEKTCKFTRGYIQHYVDCMIDIDIAILAKRFNSKTLDLYKGDKSLQAQITSMYGDGEHLLIKNHVVGAGKGVKYCTLEEVKLLERKDLDLSSIWSELEAFVE